MSETKLIRQPTISKIYDKFLIIGVVDAATGKVYLSEAELALLYIEIHKILFVK